MVDADIYGAFAVLIEAFAQNASPALTVSYPGIDFTPPAEGEWLEMRFFPNETQNVGLADDGPSAHRGFVQLTACHRPGVGIVSGITLAGAIIAQFAKGSTIGNATVEKKPWLSSVVTMDDRICHPVTIPYRRMTTETMEYALFLDEGNSTTTYTSALQLFGGGA